MVTVESCIAHRFQLLGGHPQTDTSTSQSSGAGQAEGSRSRGAAQCRVRARECGKMSALQKDSITAFCTKGIMIQQKRKAGGTRAPL